jgi:hypothetical protein
VHQNLFLPVGRALQKDPELVELEAVACLTMMMTTMKKKIKNEKAGLQEGREGTRE